MSKICIGIDTGGTFTDIVAVDLSGGRDFYHKVPTTTGDPARGILDGIAEILDQNELAIQCVIRQTPVIGRDRDRNVEPRVSAVVVVPAVHVGATVPEG